MKHRKLFALLLVAAILTCVFAGCSAKDSCGSAEVLPTSANNSDGIYDSGTAATPQVTDRKLIRRVNMRTETEDLNTLLTAVDEKVAQLGGYVEKRSVQTGSRYASYEQSRYAELTIRIPAEKLDAFVSHVSNVSNVTSSSESAEDVTLKYVATESRKKALEAEEARLLTLIEKAANLTELLQLESRLTEVRTELEQVISTLKLYDNLVDYGTVVLDISEVKALTPKEEPSFGQRIADGFSGSMEDLGRMVTEFVIFFVSALPYLIPLALIAVGVVLAVKLSKKKKKEKKMPFSTEPPAQA